MKFPLSFYQINIFILIFTLVASVALGPVANVINQIQNEINNRNAVAGKTLVDARLDVITKANYTKVTRHLTYAEFLVDPSCDKLQLWSRT